MFKCDNCGKIFRPFKKNRNNSIKYCSTCKKYHKKCEICGKEIFVQARTCSANCAYELRKKKWMESCGTEHNFSKESSSRKKFEERMLIEEGITNPAQRVNVKEKIRNTFKKKYDGIDNPFSVKEIRDKIRLDKENNGIWIPLSELSEFQLYRRNVLSITQQNVRNFGIKYLKNYNLLQKNDNLNWSEKYSIDHIYSVKDGFKNKISPEIIGSIINLQIIPFSKNCAKHDKSHISLSTLNKRYKIFLDENKIN